MHCVNKFWTLAFIFMVLPSLFVLSAKPVAVQATSTPSIPQVSSITFIDYSHDLPPSTTTTVDQYTGKETTTTIPGRHVTDIRLEVTIKNQPFTTYTDANGNNHTLRYEVQYKGHFSDEQNWNNFGQFFGLSPYFDQIDGKYTVATGYIPSLTFFAAGSQLDFRVKAEIGHTQPKYDTSGLMLTGYEFIVYASSDWSDIKTYTIPDVPSSLPPVQTTNSPPNSLSPPNPSTSESSPPPPQNPLQLHLIILLVTIGIITIPIAIVTYLNKQKNVVT